MSHLIEPASTGRAKCRGCGQPITAGALRFGESVPNPFGDGETTHWFHLDCAAFKRPEAFVEALQSRTEPVEDAERLLSEARRGVAQPRLAQIDGAERSPSGRAQCRSCRTVIEKGAWRLKLVAYEDGRFMPSGFIHAGCSAAYFETADLLGRVERFSGDLSDGDLQEFRRALEAPAG